MKKCYYSGCSREGVTKEHVPPKAFFSPNRRNQLITVRSCEIHNGQKSIDDIYALSYICLNSLHSSESRDVFYRSVLPQLKYSNNKLFNKIFNESYADDGKQIVKVDGERMDAFFDSLTFALMYKAFKSQVPDHYIISHGYLSRLDDGEEISIHKLGKDINFNVSEFYKETYKFYDDEKVQSFLKMNYKDHKNNSVYNVRIFKLSSDKFEYDGDITVVHEFFSSFRVVTGLTSTVCI